MRLAEEANTCTAMALVMPRPLTSAGSFTHLCETRLMHLLGPCFIVRVSHIMQVRQEIHKRRRTRSSHFT